METLLYLVRIYDEINTDEKLYMNILNSNIESILGEAGVNQSERQVYLAGYGITQRSAELLATTGMPRPTLMAALKSLQEFGLCKTQRLDGRSLTYTMLPVTNIKSYLGRQARSIDDLMGRIDQIAMTSEGQITTQQAVDQKGLQDFLELALRCKSRQWHIIAPRDNALSHLPTNYLDYFKRVRKERQIQSETLWEPKTSDQQITLADTLMRKPRYVPENIAGTIPSMLLAFDDKLLIIDGTTQPSATLISSGSTTDTFRLLFTMAWRSVR